MKCGRMCLFYVSSTEELPGFSIDSQINKIKNKEFLYIDTEQSVLCLYAGLFYDTSDRIVSM